MLVIHSAEESNIVITESVTVATVERQLRHVLNIPCDSVVWVDGQQVGPDEIVSDGNTVEFAKVRGDDAASALAAVRSA